MTSSKIEEITARRLPPNAGRGRQKGVPNKTTATLKQALEESFNQLGGARWLIELAETEPKAYAALLAKLLPSQVVMDAKIEQVEPITEIRRTIVDVPRRDIEGNIIDEPPRPIEH